MASKWFFPQLREVVSNIQKIPELETRLQRSLDFEGMCSEESRRKVFEIQKEMKELIDDSLKVNSDLKLQGHKTAKLIDNAEVILSYLEEKSLEVQVKLTTMGYKPPRNVLNDDFEENIKESESHSNVSQENGKLSKSTHNTDKENNKQDNEKDELSLPRSPSLGKLLPSYKVKEPERNSLDSPELPCLQSKRWQKSLPSHKDSENLCGKAKTFFDDIHSSSPDSHHDNEQRIVHAKKHKLWNDYELPISPVTPVQIKKTKIGKEETAEAQVLNKPGKRFFDTPHAANKMDAVKPQLKPVLKLTPRFPPLTTFPNTPVGHCATTKKIGKETGQKRLESEKESPAFQLYSRRSIFTDQIVERHSIDDDTVNLLNCQTRAMKMENSKKFDLPDVPTDHSKKYFGYAAEVELDSPQTPELKYKLENKAEVKDIVSQNPYDTFIKILERDYEQLPDYLKRLLSYKLSRRCIELAYQNATPMSGDKSLLVITEAKLTKGTQLAGKIQPFICLLTKLGIIKKISGTDLFQFLC